MTTLAPPGASEPALTQREEGEMFLDTNVLPVARLMEERTESLFEVLGRIRDDEFVPWVTNDAYRGRWTLFGLHQREPGWVLAREFTRHRAEPRLREAYAVLARVPGLVSSCFMRLDPGAHIYPHVDDPRLHTIRFLLGLRVNAGSRMRVAEEVRAFERGRVLAFDSSVMHETANDGDTPRVVFGIEVDAGFETRPLRAEDACEAR